MPAPTSAPAIAPAIAPTLASTAWLPVAAARDLAPAAVLPVVADGTALVLWRSHDGLPHAWLDRCPHRGMRLAYGAVHPRGLICPYHGWRFGTDAQCNHTPAHPQATPSQAARAQAWQLQEAAGWLWVLPPGAEAGLPAWPAQLHSLRSMHLPCEASAAAALWQSADGPAAEAASAPGQALYATQPWGPDGLPCWAFFQPAESGACVLHLAT